MAGDKSSGHSEPTAKADSSADHGHGGHDHGHHEHKMLWPDNYGEDIGFPCADYEPLKDPKLTEFYKDIDWSKGPVGYKEGLIHRVLARTLISRPREYPRWPGSHTTGVMGMNIEGRFTHERERVHPDYSEIDRKWRIQWIMDQQLAPTEPRYVPFMDREYYNPIRRFYMAPGNYLERQILTPRIGLYRAHHVRWFIGKMILGWITICAIYYEVKYNYQNWEENTYPIVEHEKECVYPGDHRYPMPDPKPTQQDHYDHGFKFRHVFKDLDKKKYTSSPDPTPWEAHVEHTKLP